VEQAHNAVYSYLHHLRRFHGDGFNWAELLPSVAYMHNTSVQTHKSESPMFQRYGRNNSLANADTLVTDEVLHEDEYRSRFDASFGTTEDQEQETQGGSLSLKPEALRKTLRSLAFTSLIFAKVFAPDTSGTKCASTRPMLTLFKVVSLHT